MLGMDTLGMVDMDIMEGRGGLPKQSPLLKQIQRLRLILTIFMVDMGLDIMDMADMDIMEGRGGLPKQSPLLKQIQRVRLILTICMVDMGLDIMDMADLLGMDTLGMVDMDIMEGRGGLPKLSPLLKQIQRLRLIFMVDMGLDIMDMADMPGMDTLGMADMDIMEERGLPKQSPLLKQIQRLILTICMVDMGLDIMDMVVMPDMDTLGMDIMDMENKPVQ